MQRDFAPMVYIIASARNGTLYVGVTSNLMQRIAQHRDGSLGGFSARYGTRRLVWLEPHATMEHAILREKRIKKWNRAWKLRLIEETNPDWRDLALDYGFEPLRRLDRRLRGDDHLGRAIPAQTGIAYRARDQAKLTVVRRRPRIAPPTRPKPMISMAQTDGSGTPATEGDPKKAICEMLCALLLNGMAKVFHEPLETPPTS